MIWLGIGSQMAKSRGMRHNQFKPLSVENCAFMNLTANATSPSGFLTEEYIYSLLRHYNNQDLNIYFISREDFHFLWKISYLWYTMIGVILMLILGTVISFLTKAQDPSRLDKRLISSLYWNKYNKVNFLFWLIAALAQTETHLKQLCLFQAGR